MQTKPKVILLAAGRGRRFGRRTALTPKCLIPLIKGETLLARYLQAFRKLGLRDIVVVVGHQKEKIVEACVEDSRGLSIRFPFNPLFKKGSIVSLHTAREEMMGDCLVMDADVYFRPEQLKTLLRAKKSSFLIDPQSKSSGEEMMLMAPATKASAGKRGARPCHISKKVDPRLRSLGEATGFLLLRKKDAQLLAQILEKMVRSGKTECEYEESYNALMKTRRLGYEKISGFWSEMDFEEDLLKILKAVTP